MKWLTKDIADEIINITSSHLEHNLNVMNEKGMIISSNEPKRIGTVHEGAIRVINNKEKITINQDMSFSWKGVKPGINLPIFFQNKTIGVVGITGEPQTLNYISSLVKMTTELIIAQNYIMKKKEWKKNTKQIVIEELMKDCPSYNYIKSLLNYLKFNFGKFYFTTVIQFFEQPTSEELIINKYEDKLGDKNTLIYFIDANRIIIIMSVDNNDEFHTKIKKSYYFFESLNINFSMSYSNFYKNLNNFKTSYKDCLLTLKLNDTNKNLVSFSQIEAQSLLYQADNISIQNFINRVFQNINNVQKETLKNFFENDLNIQKTSDRLFVHRNTLIYRLNKIKNDTGYDPKNFKDALTLQIALWLCDR